MSARERPSVACVEDADEDGNSIGNRRYASSIAPSPTKEQPNTGRARNKARRSSSSPIHTDSDSTVHPHKTALKKASFKEKSLTTSKKDLVPAPRPAIKHSKTTANVSRRDNEASYYGVDPATIMPASSRPRAQTGGRPVSYYGASSRPPLANARWYANQPAAPPVPTSFPPPSWSGGPVPVPIPYPHPPPSPSPIIMQQPTPPDYFSTRPLEARFGSVGSLGSSGSIRPQSAIGFRPPRPVDYDDYIIDEPPERALARRPSTHRKASKNDDDRRAMPPPPPRRPASARPTALAFRPPPATPARRSVGFDDEDLEGDSGLFQDLSPLAPQDYSAPLAIRTRPRRPSIGAGTSIYDVADFRAEVAGKQSRRNSYYGNSSAGSGYEDKLRTAARYQEDIMGGPGDPLTAESLRKAARNASSSRSSGSHDESEYRQSATTRTTRSSANPEEDVTIRVKGGAVLTVGGAQLQCEDGAEINLSSRGGLPGIRASSDRSSYMIEDDRRTRIELPPARVRAGSRARSMSRSYPRFDAPKYDTATEYDPYGSYSIPPPYPSYPTLSSSPVPPYPAYPGTEYI